MTNFYSFIVILALCLTAPIPAFAASENGSERSNDVPLVREIEHIITLRPDQGLTETLVRLIVSIEEVPIIANQIAQGIAASPFGENPEFIDRLMTRDRIDSADGFDLRVLNKIALLHPPLFKKYLNPDMSLRIKSLALAALLSTPAAQMLKMDLLKWFAKQLSENQDQLIDFKAWRILDLVCDELPRDAAFVDTILVLVDEYLNREDRVLNNGNARSQIESNLSSLTGDTMLRKFIMLSYADSNRYKILKELAHILVQIRIPERQFAIEERLRNIQFTFVELKPLDRVDVASEIGAEIERFNAATGSVDSADVEYAEKMLDIVMESEFGPGSPVTAKIFVESLFVLDTQARRYYLKRLESKLPKSIAAVGNVIERSGNKDLVNLYESLFGCKLVFAGKKISF